MVPGQTSDHPVEEADSKLEPVFVRADPKEWVVASKNTDDEKSTAYVTRLLAGCG